MIKIAVSPLTALIYILLLILVACNNDDPSVKYYSEAAFSIELLPSLTQDSVIHFQQSDHHRRYRYEHYAVAGYKRVPDLKVSLDSFVCGNLFKGYEEYDSYSLFFYKKTDFVNLDRFFDRGLYELYGYHFKFGKFYAVSKYHEKVSDTQTLYNMTCSSLDDQE